MNATVGIKIAGGFGLALAALGVVGVTSYLSTLKLVDTSHAVADAHEFMERLEGLLSIMKDAETGHRGYIITGEEKYLGSYSTSSDAMAQAIKELRDLTHAERSYQLRFDELERFVKAKFAAMQEMQAARKGNTDESFKAAQQLMLTDNGKKAMDEIRRVVGDMEKEQRTLLTDRSRDAEASARYTTRVITWGSPIAILLVCLAAFFITRNISGPLQTISRAAERIAGGDLTVEVAVDGRADEVGVLAKTFRRMVESLRAVTSDIAEATSVLGASATEIVASTAQLASGSAQTATAVTQTTTTVEEVRQTALVASQKAKLVSDSSQKAAAVSQSGKRITDDAAAGMDRIRDQMNSIAQNMVRLSEQTQAIEQIITTVDDLAQQSNLLAVNASIEAAKAGEHGKGFGVVAQEVKNLAEQSKQATARVRAILGEIQRATGAAVMSTDQGAKAVEVGVRQSAQAGESILALADSISEASLTAAQIAASGQQQLVGMDQVAQAMESIKLASTQNVESAKQLETAARNLNSMGRKLKDIVAKYKV